VVAAIDEGQALIVLNIHERYRARALAGIASVDELRHPGSGLYILDTYILGGTPPGQWSPESLSDIAQAVAAFAPDRAEEIAADITSDYPRVVALAEIARTVAATDPDRALRLLSDRHSP